MSGTEWKPSIPGGPDDPAEPESEQRRRADEYPRTLVTGDGGPGGRDRDRGGVGFDPALKHFAGAYRPLDPAISDPAEREAWLRTRRTAMEIALRAVAASGWADSLVLRGSMLMKRWFGPAAREPHDLDFVVVPADWRIEEERTGRMLAEIAAAAEELAGGPHGGEGDAGQGAGPVMPAAAAVSEYIWTYERVPGRRLVLPWSAPGMPGGQVQLDFVFNEPLPVVPEPVRVAGVRLLGATKELSLAWKLMWLACDMYPQGKDLYDAALLAEHCALPYALLEDVFRRSGEWEAEGGLLPITPEAFAGFANADWDEFRKEYPGLGPAGPDDTAEGCARRLLARLGPVFEEAGR
ncbi:nucleotidyl transferase AbiEii/AbiGii toxin family protein [Streptomyces sp. NBC_00536]|uniref:nucleotidyl transferase AbiEii/AbiGii toxin family protein n=1 Tax=Streptomyces sp. NBC_00536 TaxID=2975769 RepID=UPI002E800315|nr:nucleotidyl transferase AbiEii/AbiGii toxin family protein [Streptomyces sp. NBC_00536]WUC78881.1 nucleotidyl transferase AbiEii/AbiGii toxin family protein [Streptomyces sp. NBC_00536]